MAFEKTWAKKFASRAGRYPHMRAKIGTRVAHEVVAERRRAASKEPRSDA